MACWRSVSLPSTGVPLNTNLCELKNHRRSYQFLCFLVQFFCKGLCSFVVQSPHLSHLKLRNRIGILQLNVNKPDQRSFCEAGRTLPSKQNTRIHFTYCLVSSIAVFGVIMSESCGGLLDNMLNSAGYTDARNSHSPSMSFVFMSRMSTQSFPFKFAPC